MVFVYCRLHGGDNVQIKRYFVSFWNGVDLRYKLLKGPRIRISIAGIIISRVRLSAFHSLVQAERGSGKGIANEMVQKFTSHVFH